MRGIKDMRLLKSKRNIFFSTCIATVLVLFTLVFIINRTYPITIYSILKRKSLYLMYI